MAAIALAATTSGVVDMKAGGAGACRCASGSFTLVSIGVRTNPGHKAVTPKLSR
jgi:hypothetical protein